jgi:chromatin segregation and condensation protein Rec8/ScpA/Scc1 (kleisin family)
MLHLERFDGPMDLLLDLAERQQIVGAACPRPTW